MTRRARLGLVVLLLVALWAGAEASGLRAQLTLGTLRSAVAQHPVVGLAAFVALFALGNLAQVPGSVFLAAAVLALGRGWGAVATYVAASVACVLGFALVRLVGGDDALRGLGGRPGRWALARLDTHPLASVLLLRLLFQTLPALNLALGLSGVGWRAHLLGTLLGLPLPIALYALFFDALARWLHWPLPA